MDLWTRMANYFTEVCVKSFIFCYFEAPGAKQTSPKAPASCQPPRGFALRLKRPGSSGRTVQSKSAGREANAPQGLAFALLGLPCFLLASGRSRKP
jgi:hypothetical protein